MYTLKTWIEPPYREEFGTHNATCFLVLSSGEVQAILLESQGLIFEKAPEVHGAGVAQRFSFAHLEPQKAPRTMAIVHQFEKELHKLRLNGLLKLPENFSFNEFIFNKYEHPQETGIAPHRDESKFQELVIIFVIQSGGDFYVCDDKQGTNPVRFRNEPGACIIMRGGRKGEPDQRPIHFVAGLESERLTFCMRYDSSKQGVPA